MRWLNPTGTRDRLNGKERFNTNMAETIFVTTPLEVTFKVERDPSGVFVGYVREYPGIVSQARTREAVKRKLVRLLREISRDHPEELRLFC